MVRGGSLKTLVERVVEAGVPRHVALIMDGNGRWAAGHGLPRSAGHRAGAEAAERLVRFVGRKLGIEYLTLFAFSTENWTRPQEEIDDLMDLLRHFIDDKIGEFVDAGIRLRVIGEVDELPPSLAATVREAIRRTEAGAKLHLTIALNYGARQEIVRACREIGHALTAGTLTASDVNEEIVAKHLLTAEIPDPDLIIRTSGETRLSNFLLWQAAYAELHFTKTLWPGFTPAELVLTLAAFQERERRFGGVGEESAT
jgi:undecaprenyl diphosphate synthase